MNRHQLLLIVGIVLSLIGTAVLLYTVFDGVKTDTSLRNFGFVGILVGAGLTAYTRIKTGN